MTKTRAYSHDEAMTALSQLGGANAVYDRITEVFGAVSYCGLGQLPDQGFQYGFYVAVNPEDPEGSRKISEMKEKLRSVLKVPEDMVVIVGPPPPDVIQRRVG